MTGLLQLPRSILLVEKVSLFSSLPTLLSFLSLTPFFLSNRVFKFFSIAHRSSFLSSPLPPLQLSLIRIESFLKRILEQLIETRAFLAFSLIVVSLIARLHTLSVVLREELDKLSKVLLGLIDSNNVRSFSFLSLIYLSDTD